MSVEYSLGSVAKFLLEVVSGATGQTGLSPTAAIQRVADDAWFQASDGTWQPTIVENPMAEVDIANLPGLYAIEFDQSLDDLVGSRTYLLKLREVSAGVLQYQEKVFGPVAVATSPQLCSVQGTVFNGIGEPLQNIMVRATLEPVFKDALGRTLADRTAAVYTNVLGGFDLPLVRGATYRLEISSAGYDRRVTIPDQASVLFTEL